MARPFIIGSSASPKRRAMSLAPMIDVVFLLLIFFMLASQFSTEKTIEILAAGQETTTYQGAPRLVEITPQGILFNGTPTPLDQLPTRILDVLPDEEALIVIRPLKGANTQHLTDILEVLSTAGLRSLAITD